MRIEKARYTERFGAVKINEVQKILELDSGRKVKSPRKEEMAVDKIEEDRIRRIEGKMAIVIPIKNEKLKLFEGVLSGIPHDCLTVVISDSQREPADRFSIETRNPHLHEEKGDEHRREMLMSSLSVIYHSPLAEARLKEQICEELRWQELLSPHEEPAPVKVIPPPQRIDPQYMREYAEEHLPRQLVLKP